MEYRPLKHDIQEIRLLTLTGQRGSKTVDCALEHFSLRTAPRYTALSYCWGDPKVTRAITVNGKIFQATINLEAALYRLQKEGYTKLWIDAICINQKDLEERSQQVRLMRTIYSKAEVVVVWLGRETRGSTATMEYIDRHEEVRSPILKQVRALNLIGGSKDEESPDNTQGAVDMGESGYFDPGADTVPPPLAIATHYNRRELYLDRGLDAVLNFLDGTSRDGLKELFERPYWKRVWILQEVVAATNVLVYCGSKFTSMKNIEHLLVRTQEGKRLLRDGKVPNFDAFRRSPIVARSNSLVKLMMSSRNSLATDPRDKVYALLGLASDGEQLVPVPNYNHSLEDLFDDLTRSVLTVKKFATVLLFRSADRAPHDRLPSWIPDWCHLAAMNRPWHSSLAGPEGKNAYSEELLSHLFPIEALRPSQTNLPSWILDIFIKGHEPTALAPKGGERAELLDSMPEELRQVLSLADDPRLAKFSPIFRGRFLEMQGYIIDEIDGISAQATDGSPISESEEERRELQQSHNQESFYDKKDTAWAIANSISMAGTDFGPHLGSGQQTNEYIAAFSNLLSLKQRDDPLVKTWLDRNDSFLIMGRSLQDWMRSAGRLSTNSESLTENGLRFYKRSFEYVFEKYLERVAIVVGSGMRLMTTQKGKIGMAHPQAEDGDVICILLGCAMPCILRKNRSSNVYHIVGEAYLYPTWSAAGFFKKEVREYDLIEIEIE